MWYVHLTLCMLTVCAHKSTYILYNTPSVNVNQYLFGWGVFTMNFTSHSLEPSKPPSHELSFGRRCREEALWNKRKTKATVRRKMQKKGQLKKVKFATNYLTELSRPMPAIFRERWKHASAPTRLGLGENQCAQPAGTCLDKRQNTSSHLLWWLLFG